jgi:hypothetical protein
MLKKIAKLEADLSKLKVSLGKPSKESKPSKEPKPRTRKDKPSAIEKCAKKSELEKFTKKELIEWIKAKNLKLKNAAAEYKADLVKFVWKNFKKSSDSGQSESSGSEESDSDESDCSDCESESEEGSDDE